MMMKSYVKKHRNYFHDVAGSNLRWFMKNSVSTDWTESDEWI